MKLTGGQKIANVPLIATLPFIGPTGAMATAPAAYGAEAAQRSSAGGAIGTPAGAVVGSMLGALLGAGLQALSGEEHPYTAAGALLGGAGGALAGNIMGSHMALKPIYAQPGGYGMGAQPAPAGPA